MTDQFTMLDLMTSTDSSECISSPALVGGTIPSISPDGQDRFGLDPALASRSRSQARRRASTTHDTSGQSSSASSPSDALQQSLESKLRARLNGSDLCEVNWKRWDTPWGQCLSKPRARVRTTSETVSGLWPTLRASDGEKGGPNMRFGAGGYPLPTMAAKSTWLTPSASEDAAGTVNGKMQRMLTHQAKAAMWATPAAQEPGGTAAAALERKRRALANGSQIGISLTALSFQVQTQNGQLDRTEKPGQLNPEFVCWLMGYPIEWVSCGVSVTRSTQGRQRNSSPRRVTP